MIGIDRHDIRELYDASKEALKENPVKTISFLTLTTLMSFFPETAKAEEVAKEPETKPKNVWSFAIDEAEYNPFSGLYDLHKNRRGRLEIDFKYENNDNSPRISSVDSLSMRRATSNYETPGKGVNCDLADLIGKDIRGKCEVTKLEDEDPTDMEGKISRKETESTTIAPEGVPLYYGLATQGGEIEGIKVNGLYAPSEEFPEDLSRITVGIQDFWEKVKKEGEYLPLHNAHVLRSEPTTYERDGEQDYKEEGELIAVLQDTDGDKRKEGIITFKGSSYRDDNLVEDRKVQIVDQNPTEPGESDLDNFRDMMRYQEKNKYKGPEDLRNRENKGFLEALHRNLMN